ncbi:hypothetical protein BGX20_011558 [Mortierella sp. AD010]|nr:hypothetical protein BGX20_011558 [Mortierella sp. AD010]
MSGIDEPLITEATALLQDSHTTATPSHGKRTTAWYWSWKPSYWAAVVVIFLVFLSSGTTAALTPVFLRELFCERGIPKLFPIHSGQDNGSTLSIGDDKCNSAEYSAAIAKFIGVIVMFQAISMTISLRYWSALSDRIGRKKVMLICMTGMSISNVVLVIVRLNKDASLHLLYLAVIIEGATGSGGLMDILSHAYCSDLTLPEERTVIFGRIMAGSYAGLAIGSALGGIAAEKLGLDFLFIWLSPGIALLSTIYVMLIPESLTAETLTKTRGNQSQSTVIQVESSQDPDAKKLERLTFKDHVMSFIKGFTPEILPNRLAGKHGVLLLMLTTSFAVSAIVAVNTLAPTYLLYRFRWSEAKLSYIFTIVGASRLLSMTFFLPYVKRLAPHDALTNPVANINFDLKLVIVGLFVESLTFFLYGITPVGEGFYLGAALSSLGSIFNPASRGIVSQSVAPELIGETLGTYATLEVIASTLAPLAAGWLYGITLETWPSAVFHLSSLIVLISCASAFSVFLTHNKAMRSAQTM